ncbi:lipoprotein-releasing ABC transporter ATP-binding protein LolD [Glaciecola sp.]|nr:lipoprotein-releasing ABC transporter ATP-binding protein LolD [Glaciecola sp.]
MSLVAAQNVSKTFQDGEHKITILRDVNLNVAAGEHVAIVGASGSGKSTLLHILGGLDTPSSGAVFIDGNDIAKATEKQNARMRNQDIGFIYQFHHLLPEFSALENVAMPLLIGGVSDQQSQEQARALLSEVGLSHRLGHFPGQLSGGERQRVAIARALINQPKILLADEPTGNLDDATGDEIYQLLATLKAQHGFAAVVVTHDLRLAQKLDTQYRLIKGQLSAGLA